MLLLLLLLPALLGAPFARTQVVGAEELQRVMEQYDYFPILPSSPRTLETCKDSDASCCIELLYPRRGYQVLLLFLLFLLHFLLTEILGRQLVRGEDEEVGGEASLQSERRGLCAGGRKQLAQQEAAAGAGGRGGRGCQHGP